MLINYTKREFDTIRALSLFMLPVTSGYVIGRRCKESAQFALIKALPTAQDG